MILGKFAFATGNHVAGWRLPQAEHNALSLPILKNIVETAERGKLDFVFFADSVHTNLRMHPGMMLRYEPLTLLGALSACSSHIGLIGTVSTTYSEPYNLARQMASLDHLTGGRVGWNVVTSASDDAAANFGLDFHPEHSERYDRAEEYVNVVKGLWDSWDADAIIGDKEGGQLVRPSAMHELNHSGEHFSVRGPLNIPRPPQGHPVIVQAGSSARGIAFAGQVAEMVFGQQQDLAQAIAFRESLRTSAKAAGRNPDTLKVIYGICPIIGTSKADSLEKLANLGRMIDPDTALVMLEQRLGHPLGQYALDRPVPDLPPPDHKGMQGHYHQLITLAKREHLTLRQLRDYAAASTGHRLVLGTPEEIADDIATWYEAGAADGFMLMSPYHPGPFSTFIDNVLPLLIARGLFRSEYEATTLRGNLGLEIPASRYA